MTTSFDARAQADEVMAALSIYGVDARNTSASAVVALIEIEPDEDDHQAFVLTARWAFMLTPRGWSTLYSQNGIDCQPICGFVDSLAPDAAPSAVAHEIRNQLAGDVLARAVGGVRYLPRCPPD